ncbi:HSP20-like chaperones domain-containing protein [Dioscorea alata]|uniref:HSP20-like chaperones domain-containing protein n=1 Tax=Dioscorea alata TaxID=55571 RepID=A0ACB7VIF2_DIOAL|nr:HSP20-like chaperones domain-containing protein [Dioscorea alata]
MSEKKDDGESAHEASKLSSKDHSDVGVEEKGSPSLAVNPMDAHIHKLQESEAEAGPGAGASNNADLAGTTSEVGHVEAEPNDKDTGVTPDSNNSTEDLALNNATEDPPLVKHVENADEHAVVDVKKEKEGEVVDLPVESGGRHGEKDNAKRTDSEDNHNLETATKEEKEEEDPSNDAPNQSFIFDYTEGEESGTEEDQVAFMNELETFHREKNLEFKPPKFYGEGLNCLKLWRAVTRLGGYDQVTSCKLWRQVGESFRPPKTCTTVSWSFRIFYEKALLEYEKHKIQSGELQVPIPSVPETMPLEHQVGGSQGSGSGRARRDAAARAMQGWHSQRLLGNGEVGDPIIKDKSSVKDKNSKGIGIVKRKKPSSLEHTEAKAARPKVAKTQTDIMVVDVGPPADWVKINVRTTKDCFEVYALVPGLLREEVHVQSDPSGRLVISGEPEQPDNPWGVTPFKKVITLSSRIDPHQTSAVVTLHGQLFVRAPFEQSDS